jgi:hypothetical protein
VLLKLPENFRQAAAEALTTREPGATMDAGGYKPRLPRCEMASTGRHDMASIPHSKLKRRTVLCASRRYPPTPVDILSLDRRREL